MSDWQAAFETVKRRLDLRLDNYLVEMKPNYDDSITGFNEAWDVMRALFKELAAAPPPPAVRVTGETRRLIDRLDSLVERLDKYANVGLSEVRGALVAAAHALAVSFPIQQDADDIGQQEKGPAI